MLKPITCTCCIAMCCCLLAATITTGITVVYDTKKKAVDIQWQQKYAGVKSFVVQRSSNNTDWVDIAYQGTVNFNPNRIYQFLDYKAGAGQNYYRLKSISENGSAEYSASVMVITGAVAAESSWVMYPVPVTDLLTLQYKGTQKLTGVVNVFIQTINGKIMTRVRSASLNTVIRIPVDNLGKGIYDVRIVITDEVVWNQRFVK
jgi:hypothetical protein